MAKEYQIENEVASKGNSEDSLLVIYILHILKKYSSKDNPLSSQEVMEHLLNDYSIGGIEKSDAQRKKIRRHLDTLSESYWHGCIKKIEGKTRNGHKWYYDAAKDVSAKATVAVNETLSEEEIDFITDIIISSKIINSESTKSIVNKLLKKNNLSREERIARLRKIENEKWQKSINAEFISVKQNIQSCIDECCKIKFDYGEKGTISADPYGWGSDDSGKYILIAKLDGAGDGEFALFELEKIQNLVKTDADYDFDDGYFDKSFGKPDIVSMESLFANVKIINNAIEANRGIDFKYLSYAIKGKNVIVDKIDKRVLPHRLVFNEGKYYLIAYDEDERKINYFRADLIVKPNISSEKIEISDWNARMMHGMQIAREIEKHPLMLAEKDITVVFKVAESGLDRIIDAFGKKVDDLTVTNEIRTVASVSEDSAREEKVARVEVRTTVDEAFRWALSNADVVELVSPQHLRDKLGRIAEPIYQLYTYTLPDKVRENVDYVLKEGTFKISYRVDAATAYATYKELAKRGMLDVVDNMGVSGDEAFENLDYLGEFINTERLILLASHIANPTWAAKLINVKELKCSSSELTDVSWMKGMKKMCSVYLSDSAVSDLSVLSEHAEIHTLDINNTNVSDIGFIENLAELIELHIAVCPIEDYSPLFTMKGNLKYLEIDKKALEKIGEEKIRNRHLGITIDVTNNSPFWYL